MSNRSVQTYNLLLTLSQIQSVYRSIAAIRLLHLTVCHSTQCPPPPVQSDRGLCCPGRSSVWASLALLINLVCSALWVIQHITAPWLRRGWKHLCCGSRSMRLCHPGLVALYRRYDTIPLSWAQTKTGTQRAQSFTHREDGEEQSFTRGSRSVFSLRFKTFWIVRREVCFLQSFSDVDYTVNCSILCWYQRSI